jgi:hypothetical protein
VKKAADDAAKALAKLKKQQDQDAKKAAAAAAKEAARLAKIQTDAEKKALADQRKAEREKEKAKRDADRAAVAEAKRLKKYRNACLRVIRQGITAQLNIAAFGPETTGYTLQTILDEVKNQCMKQEKGDHRPLKRMNRFCRKLKINVQANMMELSNKAQVQQRPTTPPIVIETSLFGTAKIDSSLFAITSPVSPIIAPVTSFTGIGIVGMYIKLWIQPVYSELDYIGHGMVNLDGTWNIQPNKPITGAASIIASQAIEPFEIPTHITTPVVVTTQQTLLLQIKSHRRQKLQTKHQQQQEQQLLQP